MFVQMKNTWTLISCFFFHSFKTFPPDLEYRRAEKHEIEGLIQKRQHEKYVKDGQIKSLVSEDKRFLA